MPMGIFYTHRSMLVFKRGDKREVDQDGRVRETIIRLYYVRKKAIYNKKETKTNTFKELPNLLSHRILES